MKPYYLENLPSKFLTQIANIRSGTMTCVLTFIALQSAMPPMETTLKCLEMAGVIKSSDRSADDGIVYKNPDGVWSIEFISLALRTTRRAL